MSVKERDLAAARSALAAWLAVERDTYADAKWYEDRRDALAVAMASEGLAEDGEWWGFVVQYLKRAQLLGLDTPQGRQAFGKFIVTSLSCLEQAIRAFGPMPRPGLPSGEIAQ